ncbi:hypothetical protein FF36_03041 [Frankia torreyi]|uniref:Uncharacterized protein n=1 Tax=Frankia torreyi TaxID=1856 RepID=A0A0D8BF31_9ACTN|nr:hypothetical protein FF36_03041 [Frankia torreyi]KQM04462.1 hypothetical protein FF86_102666 [Frankia sp. CpI1-P]
MSWDNPPLCTGCDDSRLIASRRPPWPPARPRPAAPGCAAAGPGRTFPPAKTELSAGVVKLPSSQPGYGEYPPYSYALVE